MGCGYEMACWDCGVRQEVGYGSHATWFHANTLEEWQGFAVRFPDHATIQKNVNMRVFLEQHAGHRCEAVSDYVYDLEFDPETKPTLDRFVALRVVEPP